MDNKTQKKVKATTNGEQRLPSTSQRIADFQRAKENY
jgi:hypothetical protein